MKKQFSLFLLTISIFSINVLPGQAAIKVTSASIENQEIESKQSEYGLINGNKWCAEIPWMGLWCWAF